MHRTTPSHPTPSLFLAFGAPLEYYAKNWLIFDPFWNSRALGGGCFYTFPPTTSSVTQHNGSCFCLWPGFVASAPLPQGPPLLAFSPLSQFWVQEPVCGLDFSLYSELGENTSPAPSPQGTHVVTGYPEVSWSLRVGPLPPLRPQVLSASARGCPAPVFYLKGMKDGRPSEP